MSRFCTESTETLALFFLFAIFGVQEILNRIFHNDLKGANLYHVFVLLSVLSR
jgi:hypothetical protein